ncbi:conserved unknown protein [Ectocarpus siliculosus]|uniref:Cytochrome b561 domain-containing protein n=1 Tax=Ectocarpus siliculosus TaxID=2880 RepID=D8LSD3_ECTSI|nr:conserved unknown protein [Ectocarpus siliculosus]|eukprot:CBN75190.1 conserved unknown protein [Ectocarpus siliculosus]
MEKIQVRSLWAAHVMSWTALIMVLVWALANQDDDYFLGGLAFSGTGLFNWHPVLMVAGLVVAYTQGILAYRTLSLEREVNKMIHNACMFTAVILVSLGLIAVFQYHNKELYANLYTMHSWAGIVVVTLFYANYVGGFFNFFTGSTPQWMKAQYLPNHVFIGIFTYFAAAFTTLLGIQDKNSALGCGYDITLTEPDYNPASHYSNLYAGCRLSNGLGIVVIVTCLCATYAVMPRKPEQTATVLDAPLL